jgi:sulfur-oxidizing protein SoxX
MHPMLRRLTLALGVTLVSAGFLAVAPASAEGTGKAPATEKKATKEKKAAKKAPAAEKAAVTPAEKAAAPAAAAATAAAATAAAASPPDTAAMVEQGKKIAMDRSAGNCIACHVIPGGEAPGTIGPPLVAIQARYPSKDKLREQLWDSTQANPASAMPPFGKNQILSDEQLNQVVEFVWTL